MMDNVKDDFIIAAGEYTLHKGGVDLSPVLFYCIKLDNKAILKDE